MFLRLGDRFSAEVTRITSYRTAMSKGLDAMTKYNTEGLSPKQKITAQTLSCAFLLREQVDFYEYKKEMMVMPCTRIKMHEKVALYHRNLISYGFRRLARQLPAEEERVRIMSDVFREWWQIVRASLRCCTAIRSHATCQHFDTI